MGMMMIGFVAVVESYLSCYYDEHLCDLLPVFSVVCVVPPNLNLEWTVLSRQSLLFRREVSCRV